MRRLLPLTLVLVVVTVCFTAGSASALTFQDRTCDNSKPTCPLPKGQVGVPYEFDMYARSGCPPYYYTVTGGALPPGLTLQIVNDNATGGIGKLSGTPTVAGSYSFYVTITTPESPTCLGDRADRLFTMDVDQAPLGIATAALAPGIVGQAYSQQLSSTGNGSWSASGLPAGLSVSGSSITGTPTTAGDYTVTLTLSNGATTKTSQLPMKVVEPLTLTPTLPEQAEVGVPYTANVAASGGFPAYTWTVGELPPGLTFDSQTGALSGTPAAAGIYQVHVVLTDTSKVSTTKDLNIAIAPKLAVAPARLRQAGVGRRYAAKLNATGGARPLRWRQFTGKLPVGIRLSATTGTLTGTPRRPGVYRFRVLVTDALRVRANRLFFITVK